MRTLNRKTNTNIQIVGISEKKSKNGSKINTKLQQETYSEKKCHQTF